MQRSWLVWSEHIKCRGHGLSGVSTYSVEFTTCLVLTYTVQSPLPVLCEHIREEFIACHVCANTLQSSQHVLYEQIQYSVQSLYCVSTYSVEFIAYLVSAHTVQSPLLVLCKHIQCKVHCMSCASTYIVEFIAYLCEHRVQSLQPVLCAYIQFGVHYLSCVSVSRSGHMNQLLTKTGVIQGFHLLQLTFNTSRCQQIRAQPHLLHTAAHTYPITFYLLCIVR